MFRPLFAFLTLFTIAAHGQAPVDEPLVVKPFAELSDHSLSQLGAKALGIRTTEWKHAETQNFIYHFRQDSIVGPVASEAEFYYRVIAHELEKDTTQWERKGHIYIFEDEEEWHQFQAVGGLEPWTGGIHSQGELFIPRYAKNRFKGNTLAHELTHLIVFRFFGSGVPLWLNEGLAEYTATRWYASYWRARGYNARPHSHAVSPDSYIPVSELANLVTYPTETEKVITFYAESERLVRFLSATDKHKFTEFLESMGKGARIETALDRSYGTHFFDLDALDKEFKPYAAKDHTDVQN